MPQDPLILVVENDTLMVMFYDDLLRRQGYRTPLAPSAMDVQRTLQTERPAAAIVDLRLRDAEDGRVVAATLSERRVPVIIASGYSHTLTADFLLRVRPAAVLPKPASQHELLAALSRAVQPEGRSWTGADGAA